MKYTINYPLEYVKPELPGGLRWVAALRSGQYIQGEDALIDINGDGSVSHCCLGVLCELQGRPKTGGEDKYPGFDGDHTSLMAKNPLFDVLKFAGDLPSGVAVHTPDTTRSVYTDLASLNDGGFTFREIADIIEAVFDLK